MNFVNPTHTSEASLKQFRESYTQGSPFPHVVLDHFLEPGAAGAVLEEFYKTRGDWIRYRHFNQNKFGINDLSRMGPLTQRMIEELNSSEFTRFLERIAGIDGLISDPGLDGGGLQEMRRGGFLNLHVDALSHPLHENWSREINLILFLNKGWKEEYGGSLELWDREVKSRVKSIPPLFNRCVIFHTTADSYHGIPEKIRCPGEESRRSLILYYFRERKEKQKVRPTFYRPRPNDALPRRLLIVGDRALIRTYTALRRRFKISEEAFQKLLKPFLR